MFNVALLAIRADLGLSTTQLEWVISGYVVGYGGFMLLGGRAADSFGRRRVFLIGLVVFAIFSGLSVVGVAVALAGWRQTIMKLTWTRPLDDSALCNGAPIRPVCASAAAVLACKRAILAASGWRLVNVHVHTRVALAGAEPAGIRFVAKMVHERQHGTGQQRAVRTCGVPYLVHSPRFGGQRGRHLGFEYELVEMLGALPTCGCGEDRMDEVGCLDKGALVEGRKMRPELGAFRTEAFGRRVGFCAFVRFDPGSVAPLVDYMHKERDGQRVNLRGLPRSHRNLPPVTGT